MDLSEKITVVEEPQVNVPAEKQEELPKPKRMGVTKSSHRTTHKGRKAEKASRKINKSRRDQKRKFSSRRNRNR